MKHEIVIDSRFADDVSAGAGRVVEAANAADVVESLLDDEVEVAVVVGDDATLGWLATADHELLRSRPELLLYFPVTVGDAATVGQMLESPATGRSTFRKLSRLIDGARVRRVPTLRIIDSAEQTARLGFTLGMGLPYGFWSQYRQTSRGGRVGAAEAFARLAKKGLGPRDSAVDADVFVDWELHAERFGYAMVSALGQTWFDVAMSDDGPSIRLGNSAVELVGARSRVGRLVERARRAGAQNFQRIHIDTNSGYVVDGELCSSERPRTVAMTSGPAIQCLAP